MNVVTFRTRVRVASYVLTGALVIGSASACTEKKPMPSEPVIVTTVAVVDVVPDTASIVVGQTRQFNALILDRAGNPVSAKATTWSSSNPTIAVVSSTGLMLAKGVGLVSISATADGRTGSAAVAVR